eukprot:CAMPEP_0198431132 /NCGR_PEP_ID=MMETSP1452-20131203/17595_1 /TAXON_ID=1181717 /ORGANISM="Synchroma pusillum, Strain CCMP3072" /LENGTH=304 /DNA_ID=CAMNT_0044151587 /DNA_START=32 /DNA_END=946 /DNA_ORIENTATION=-
MTTYGSVPTDPGPSLAENGGAAAGGGVQLSTLDTLNASAREAFLRDDPALSRLIHDRRNDHHEEMHDSAGEFIKTIVFGGLDGILTSFAIVAGAAGGGVSWQVVLVLGFSNIIADAFSMGAGEYMASKAQSEYVQSERAREQWELRNHREGEIEEMVNLYVEKGLKREDADLIVRKMSQYDDFFVSVMLREELGLTPPDDDDESGMIKEAIVMFLSFVVFGLVPLLGYTIVPPIWPGTDSTTLFVLACCVTLVALFTLGAVKSHFSPKSWLRGGAETAVVGSCCAAVAFLLGDVVTRVVEAKAE